MINQDLRLISKKKTKGLFSQKCQGQSDPIPTWPYGPKPTAQIEPLRGPLSQPARAFSNSSVTHRERTHVHTQRHVAVTSMRTVTATQAATTTRMSGATTVSHGGPRARSVLDLCGGDIHSVSHLFLAMDDSGGGSSVCFDLAVDRARAPTLVCMHKQRWCAVEVALA